MQLGWTLDPENGHAMNAFPKKPQKPIPPEAFGI